MKRENLPGFSATSALAGDGRVVVPAADFTRAGPELFEKCRLVIDEDDPLKRPYLVCTRRYVWPGHLRF